MTSAALIGQYTTTRPFDSSPAPILFLIKQQLELRVMDIAPAGGGNAERKVRMVCGDMLACGMLLEVLSLLRTTVRDL